MKRFATVLALLGALSSVGCAAEEPEVGSAVENHTEKDIRFDVWDAPVELALAEPEAAAVAYGECERVEPSDEDVDIQINCGQAWTEVAWFVIPAETVEELAPSGVLRVAVAVPTSGQRLRGSIHRVTDDGTAKLTSRSALFDGDVIEAPIEEIADHYVYFGRGRDLINVWGTGEMPFEATLLAE